ncbi:electron transport complex subunit RsxG [Pseudothauera nasutitermitis]|uniref:Ion-translocating oxidoreductase complex subunit G n=1 Tax=Pseudothauera nasutitermitis TaxID=2565930 RepID=A0A4S4AZ19_9RHOO|nr:electron transport complex subunit RsxG [Pseudothauera nasutitermitis]THF64601.1 electron transport complex subunit RsxG [Pseudothauera nasutitermitis]
MSDGASTKHLDSLWFQGVSLGAVALVATTALAFAYRTAGPAIALAEARDVAASLAQVLPENFHDNDLLADTTRVDGVDGRPLTVHRARRQGEVKAVIFQMVGKGYAGPIRLVMGVDLEGRLTGVRITGHTETPGLGDKIEVARHPWVHSFAGKSLEDPVPARWAVKKDGGEFDQFAGATITPRAVVQAVKAGLDVYAAQRAAMLADAPAANGSPSE